VFVITTSIYRTKVTASSFVSSAIVRRQQIKARRSLLLMGSVSTNSTAHFSATVQMAGIRVGTKIREPSIGLQNYFRAQSLLQTKTKMARCSPML
jgi:hypothetical protein